MFQTWLNDPFSKHMVRKYWNNILEWRERKSEQKHFLTQILEQNDIATDLQLKNKWQEQGPTFSNIEKKEEGKYKWFTTTKNAYLFYKEVTFDRNHKEQVNHQTKLLTYKQCDVDKDEELPLWYSMTLVFCKPKRKKGKVTCTGIVYRCYY